jgi:hypothetical protein
MKVHIVFVTMFLLLNCSDEVKFRSPSFEAQKDGIVFWNANFLAADIDNNGFIIEGRNSGEKLQLITSSESNGVFELSGDSDNVAIYVDTNGTVFSTKNVPDPNISIFPKFGEINIENVDNENPRNISGTFWFYAYTEDGLNSINFIEGVFYKIPLLGGLERIE